MVGIRTVSAKKQASERSLPVGYFLYERELISDPTTSFLSNYRVNISWAYFAEEIGATRYADGGAAVTVSNKIAGRDRVTHVAIVLGGWPFLREHYSRAAVQRLWKRLACKAIDGVNHQVVPTISDTYFPKRICFLTTIQRNAHWHEIGI